MPERTAAEVLAGKLTEALSGTAVSAMESWASHNHIQRAAAHLAEDPAITVRTDLVVDRFLLEIHHVDRMEPWTPQEVFQMLTGPSAFADNPDHRVVVRPYPEEEQ